MDKQTHHLNVLSLIDLLPSCRIRTDTNMQYHQNTVCILANPTNSRDCPAVTGFRLHCVYSLLLSQPIRQSFNHHTDRETAQVLRCPHSVHPNY